MDKISPQTFILTINEIGQKICTSQSDPTKRFILNDNGNMVQCEPVPSVSSGTLDNDVDENSMSDDDSGAERIAQLPDPTQLGMIPLDNPQDFEQNLMNELDSEIMNMVDPTCHYVMQHMDIREPLSKLRKLIEQKLNLDLSKFAFFLQETQVLEDHKNLVDQCVQGEGLVQVNVQIQLLTKKINIIDVLKPAKDYVHKEQEIEDVDNPEALSEEMVEEILPEDAKNIVQWQVDLQYKKEQERLKIPLDPLDWSDLHVRHWIQWAVRQFNLSNIKLSDWNMTGKTLYKLTMNDFQKIVPNDPGDVFWTHLELLRKMKLVATRRESPLNEPMVEKEYKVTSKTTKYKVLNQYNSALKTFVSPYCSQGSGNKSGNNGQIQLWQFLLELLTSKEYKSIIQWTGKDAEFKLTHPEVVAHLWGERKNKPTMNYEKLSRALRYYYDGDMISKVPGKRFVYKFVCDLKQLLGYSASELANLIKYGNPMIKLS